MDRKLHTWKVSLVGVNSQQQVTRELRTFWDPTTEDAEWVVGNTAQAQEFVRQGKKEKFMPISAEYVG